MSSTTSRQLDEILGSVWTDQRRRHRGKTWRVEKYTNRGVFCRLLKSSYGGRHANQGNKGAFANFSYKDLQLFFTSDFELQRWLNERENFMGNPPELTEIQRQTLVPTTIHDKAPMLRKCTDKMHQGNPMIDVAKFDYSRKPGATGQLKTVCRDCCKHRDEVSERYRAKKRAQAQVTQSVEIAKVAESSTYGKDSPKVLESVTTDGDLPLWTVTVIGTIIRHVRARDYLDAGVAATANGGEVVKIEKYT